MEQDHGRIGLLRHVVIGQNCEVDERFTLPLYRLHPGASSYWTNRSTG